MEVSFAGEKPPTSAIRNPRFRTFMSDLVLAIDQGTTNTKAIVVDRSGHILARAAVPVEIAFPKPAWVEQDPIAIWKGVESVVESCLRQIAPAVPKVLGISNQRETVLIWNRRTGDPLGPAVVWQCRRTAEFCRELQKRGLEPVLRERTGLTIDPLFSASKARWLLREADKRGVRRDQLCIGNVDSWLLWKFTGGIVHVTDASNAARTQLMNLRTVQWDSELLELFDIPGECLPEIRHSSEIVGETRSNLPVGSLIGDSHAALFGQCGFLPGSIKATYGTGSSLMTPTQKPLISERGISSTVAWSLSSPTYALEGNISVTGAAVQWFGQFLGVERPAEKVAELARQITDTEGVYVVPAFVGLGAPYWDESARGIISGITRGTTSRHVARAVINSLAYQIRDVFDLMQAESGRTLEALLADGGATRNDQLMQFQADILNCAVLRNSSPDVSALGAAFLAGLAAGVWSGLDEIARLPREFDRFEPKMAEQQRVDLYAGWQAAVEKARER
jgi:glycerol kinase